MAVIPLLHPAVLDAQELLKQCQVNRGRRSGPGGQHRHKVETAIRLVHEPTGLTASATERRNQRQNLWAATFRLRIKLALTVRSKRNPVTWPSGLWRSRCCEGRISCSSRHPDFPAMLAEALDGIAACQFDTKGAAAGLGVSPSQLIKFLEKEPLAMVEVNKQRRSRGLRLLK